MKPNKLLLYFYFTFSILGLIIPWYFNIQQLMSPLPFTLFEYFRQGMATPFAASITTDFFIGTIPVLIWMMIEAERVGMKYKWAYFILTFMIAFAFTCPLFLYNREKLLLAKQNSL